MPGSVTEINSEQKCRNVAKFPVELTIKYIV